LTCESKKISVSSRLFASKEPETPTFSAESIANLIFAAEFDASRES